MLKPFLTANWRYLAMLNFAIDPKLLEPHLPVGTELYFYNGETDVSVVGFLFDHTVVLGLPIPGHRNFEEVNLRFYMRKKSADTWQRGVVFIRELVPKIAIADGEKFVETLNAKPISAFIADGSYVEVFARES